METEYAIAAGYYERQQWDESVGALTAFIKNYPETRQSAAAQFFLGEASIQVNDYQQAAAAFERFIADNPNHEFIPRAKFRLGESLFRSNQVDQAVRALEGFVRDYPRHDLNQFALSYLGQLRIKRSEPQLAQAAFQAALKYYPNSSLSGESRLGLGNALLVQGDIAEAKRIFKFMADVADQQHSSLSAEACLRLGEIAFQTKAWSEADQNFKIARRHGNDAHRGQATYWLARSAMAQEQHAAAVDMIEKITDGPALEDVLSESNGSALFFDGAISAAKADQTELACRWLQQLRQQYSDSDLVDESLHLEIQLQRELQNDQQVETLSKTFVERFPSNRHRAAIEESLGRIQYSAGNFSAAVETFDRLIDFFATHESSKKTTAAQDTAAKDGQRDRRADWYYFKGLAYLGLDRNAEAQEAFQSARGHSPDGDLDRLISLASATAYFEVQDYAAAVPHYERYLSEMRDDAAFVRAACEAAVCYVDLNQWENADQAFERLRQFPDDDHVVQTAQYLAEHAYDADQIQLARRWYEFMIEDHHRQQVIAQGLAGLAWVMLESDNTQSSMDFYKRLLSDYPDSNFSRKAIAARAQHLEKQGHLKRAQQSYQLLIDRFPQSPIANKARLRKARLLVRNGGRQNLKTAQKLLQDFLQSPESQPSADEALYHLGWALQGQGKRDDSIVRFERLVAQFPDSPFWPDAAFRLVQYYMRHQKYAKADRIANRIMERENTSHEVLARTLYLKSQLSAREEKWSEVAKITESLRGSTSDPRLLNVANYWQAESLYQQGMFNRSSQLFATIIDADQLEAKLKPWAHLRLAQCLGKLERWSSAAAVAEEGHELFENFGNRYEFSFVEARSLEARGLMEDAKIGYQQIIQSSQGRGTETAAMAQWRIGEMHFHQEDYQSAIEAYYLVDSIYDFPKWRSVAMLQAGKCQEHLGNYRHATKLYENLVKNFPDSEMASAAGQRLDWIVRQANVPSTAKQR